MELLVSDWIIEHYCHYALHRFKDNAFVVDEVLRNFIDGMFGVIKDEEDIVNKKEVAFLALLGHLFHVQTLETSSVGEDGSGSEDFEDLSTSFSLVLQCISKLVEDTVDHTLIKKAEMLQNKTVLQAVCILCRKKQYGIAETISEKLSPLCENTDQVQTKIKAIFKAKNRPASCLEEESFRGFMESVGKFMTAVHKTFKPPVLATLAHAITMMPSQYPKRMQTSSRSLNRMRGDVNVIESSKVRQSQLACALEKIQAQVIQVLASATYKQVVATAEDKKSENETDKSENCMERKPRKRMNKKFSATNLCISSQSLVHREKEITSPSKSPQMSRSESGRHRDDPSRNHSWISSHSLCTEAKKTRGSKSSGIGESSPEVQCYRRRKRSHSPADNENSTSSNVETVRSGTGQIRGERHLSRDSVHKASLGKSPAKWPKNLKVPWVRHSLAPQGYKPNRIMWTASEEEDFYKAVQEYGVGNWALIRARLKTHRTNVQLKDKWRTILNTSVDDLKRKFGPVPGV